MYTPNFKDPRTRTRVKEALVWVSLVFKEDQDESLHHKTIVRKLGSGNLGHYLKTKLLICTNPSYVVKEKCKEYRLNERGFTELTEILTEHTPPLSTIPLSHTSPENTVIRPLCTNLVQVSSKLNLCSELFRESLRSGVFKYEQRTSARRWHTLQNLPKADRVIFWPQHGYTWDSDIELCAPTLLYQEGLKHGFTPNPGILDLLGNKQDFREHLARVCFGPTYTPQEFREAKNLVNALFCGARMARSSTYSAVYKALKFDPQALKALQQDARVQALRDGINALWVVLGACMDRGRTKHGKLRQVTPRQKWQRYFELERQVQDLLDRYLVGRRFWVHDGWVSDTEPDPKHLAKVIQEELGFQVQIVTKRIR